MFRRKGAKKTPNAKGKTKAKKAVGRLLEKPNQERMAAIADLAARENLHPFSMTVGSGLGGAGACEAVAVAMAMFPDHRFIQVEGCRAIEALADGDAENVKRLGQAGCCELVEKALARFPKDSSLQTQGCRAVTNLFNGVQNTNELEQENACDFVTAALKNFPMDQEVQIEACGAVANLANISDDNRVKLGHAGACDVVTRSMTAFPDNIDVQLVACVAVGNLANRYPANKNRLGAAGACNKVCAALAGFQGNLGVQYMGCGAVGNLSHSHPQNCTRLGEAGGCLLVTGGMNAFPDDRNLQHVGCAAVANLAMGNELNARRLVKARARIAVQRAMDTFMGDKEIQTRGSQALQWLTTDHSWASQSMRKVTGKNGHDGQGRGGSRGRDASVGGRETGRRGGHARGFSVPNMGGADRPDQVRDRNRGHSFDSLNDGVSSAGDDDYGTMGEDDDGDDAELDDADDYTSLEEDEPSSDDDDEPSEEDDSELDDDVSEVSSVFPAGFEKAAAAATAAAAAAAIATVAKVKETLTPAPAAQPPSPPPANATTKKTRPPSKAELPMGALLEDFDSDGEGNYGPAPPRPEETTKSVVTKTSGSTGRADETVAGGGRVAVGPSPPGLQAPTPDILTSGGDPAARHHQTRGSTSSNADRGSSQQHQGGANANAGKSSRGGSSRMPAAGGDPASKPNAHEQVGKKGVAKDTGNTGPGFPGWSELESATAAAISKKVNGVSVGGSGGGVAPTRKEMDKRDRASGSTGGDGRGHHRRHGSTGSRHGSTGSRRSAGGGGNSSSSRRGEARHPHRAGSSGSRGSAKSRRSVEGKSSSTHSKGSEVTAIPVDYGDDDVSKADRVAKEAGQSTRSKMSTRSFGSSRSSKSGRSSSHRRRPTAREFLMDPAMASAPGVAELLKHDEAVAVPLGKVTGRDPAMLSGMLANVEMLVQQSLEMNRVTHKVLQAMTSSTSPLGQSMPRREYFDVLYGGFCGAHIAAAVIARGGIVADSKDGWLRKASALVMVVSAACPIVSRGVGLLGKALQLAERTRIADHLEQVAKSSKTPGDVSALMEDTAMRLIREGRAETNSASLDASEALENPTDEWLPAWLLEEADAAGAGNSTSGRPGCADARRAALADGCYILKTTGKRSLRKANTNERRVEVLVAAIMKTASAGASSSASEAHPDISRGTASGSNDQHGRKTQQQAMPYAAPAPPSVASNTYYPPISPSTLPPGQGSMASPTGSAIGALRRAEAKGARAISGNAGLTRDGAQSGVGSSGIATREKAPPYEAFIGGGRFAAAKKEPAEPEKSGVTKRSAVARGTSSAARIPRSSSEEPSPKSAPSKKVIVPEIFKQASSKTLTSSTVVPPAARRGVAADSGASSGRDAGRAPSVPVSAEQSTVRQMAGTGQAVRERSSSGAEKSTGPRRLKVAGRGGRVGVPAAKRRDAPGLAADGTAAAAVAAAGVQSERRSSSSPKSAARRSPRGAGSGSKGSAGAAPPERKGRSPGGGKGVRGPSPRGAAGTAGSSNDLSGQPQPQPQQPPQQQNSVSVGQKSWGRSGSWYEPRRRGMSQSSVAMSAFYSKHDDEDDDDDEDFHLSEKEKGSVQVLADRGDQGLTRGGTGSGKTEMKKDAATVDGDGRRPSSRDSSDGGGQLGHMNIVKEDLYFNKKKKKDRRGSAGTDDATGVGGIASASGVLAGGGVSAPPAPAARAPAAAAAPAPTLAPAISTTATDEGSWRNRDSAGDGSSVTSSTNHRPRGSGSLADKLAVFGSAVLSVMSGKGGNGGGGGGCDDTRSVASGRSRSSDRKGSSRGNSSMASRSRSVAPHSVEEPDSPAGYVRASEGRQGSDVSGYSSRRGGAGRGDAHSPASSKQSASSRIGNFFSGSNKHTRAKEQAAARDTFASSDDDSDSIEPPFGRRMRPRANSKSNLALPRESYMVAPADEDQQQQQQQQQAIPSRSHNRSSSAMSVSQMIKQAEKNIANQSTAKPGRTASSGPARWPR